MLTERVINTSRRTFPKGSVGYIQPVGNRIKTFPTHPDTSWNLLVTPKVTSRYPNGYIIPLPRRVHYPPQKEKSSPDD